MDKQTDVKVQDHLRIQLPMDWADELRIEVGDRVVLRKEEGRILILPAKVVPAGKVK